MTKHTIAIVGVNGVLGTHVIAALLSPIFRASYNLPIRAITRDPSKARSIAPDSTDADLKFFTADVVSGEGLDEVFEGVDVVINLLGMEFSHQKVADSAATAHIKLYIPSEFGVDIPNSGPYADLLRFKTEHVDYARRLGLNSVVLITSLFTEWLCSIPAFGINAPEPGEFRYYGDFDTKVATTSLIDFGKIIASIVAKDPASIPPKILTRSSVVTPRIMYETYKKTTGKELKIVALPLEEIDVPALEIVEEGAKSSEEFITGLLGLMYTGRMYNEGKDNEFVSKGKFEFQKFESVSRSVWQK